MSEIFLAVVVAIGGILVSVLTSIVGSDIHGWMPRLARELTRRTAGRKPLRERRDFYDEMIDLISCYEADGLKLTALLVSCNEWVREICKHPLPVSARSDGYAAPRKLVLALGTMLTIAGTRFTAGETLPFSLVVGSLLAIGLVVVGSATVTASQPAETRSAPSKGWLIVAAIVGVLMFSSVSYMGIGLGESWAQALSSAGVLSVSIAAVAAVDVLDSRFKPLTKTVVVGGTSTILASKMYLSGASNFEAFAAALPVGVTIMSLGQVVSLVLSADERAASTTMRVGGVSRTWVGIASGVSLFTAAFYISEAHASGYPGFLSVPMAALTCSSVVGSAAIEASRARESTQSP